METRSVQSSRKELPMARQRFTWRGRRVIEVAGIMRIGSTAGCARHVAWDPRHCMQKLNQRWRDRREAEATISSQSWQQSCVTPGLELLR